VAIMEDIYSEDDIEEMSDDGSLDSWEAGFMQGYLGDYNA